MAKMAISNVYAKQYKGIQEAEYVFPGNPTWICGKNGSGKTTVASIPLWVLTDYSLDLQANPLVENYIEQDGDPTGSILCNVDGTEVKLSKIQKISRTYDEEDGPPTRKINNTFMVNDVPVRKKDFEAKLMALGFDPTILLPCMCPDYFVNQSAADMKKVLFDMTTEKSDLEIAQMYPELKDIAKLLEKYTTLEVDGMAKASRTKAMKRIQAIPEQITGMELAKVDADPEPLKERRAEIEAQIKATESEIVRSKEDLEDIRSRLLQAQRDISNFEEREKDKAVKFKRKAAEKSIEIRKKIQGVKDEWADLRRKYEYIQGEIAANQKKKTTATERYRAVKAENPPQYIALAEITEEDMICPTCGQKLPEKQRKAMIADHDKKVKATKAAYERALESWTALHSKQLEEITKDGQAACDAIREYESAAKDIQKALNKANKNLEKLESDLEKTSEIEETGEYVPDAASIQEEERLKEQERYVKQLYDAAIKIREEQPEEDARYHVRKLRQELEEIDRTLGAIENNERVTEKIESLKEERMQMEQERANAEKILSQLDQLSKFRNDLLWAEINSHFSLVKFDLFEYQKNGKYKEVCIPTIDGYRFGESANTGREIMGKLDICQSLQKFYGVSLPIILDGAESINDFNIPEIESQLILLKVTDDEELTIR